MYGSNTQRLKEFQIDGGELVLYKSVQHRHAFLKSGRGTIKTEITYLVCFLPADYSSETDLYRGTRKADANKVFRIAKKHGFENYQKIVRDLEDLCLEIKAVSQ